MTRPRFAVFSLLLLVFGLVTSAAAQPPSARAATPPRIDGKLDEAVWTTAPAITAFKQREP